MKPFKLPDGFEEATPAARLTWLTHAQNIMDHEKVKGYEDLHKMVEK